MADETFFRQPNHDWQRRYEALRASFVHRLPARVVADRFGYSPAYVNLLSKLGYRGAYTIECEMPDDPQGFMSAGITYLRTL